MIPNRKLRSGRPFSSFSGLPGSIHAVQLILIFFLICSPTGIHSLPRRNNPEAAWENGPGPGEEHSVKSSAPASPLPSLQTHAGPMMFASFSQHDLLHPRVIAELDERTRNDSLSAHWSAMIRSELYRDYIRSEILRQRVPTELMAVAYIESSFDVMAESRTGARGLWQFADNSLAPWLSRSETFPRFDERFDFRKSTIAAMEKLMINRRETGDWISAVAAYNGGLGRLSRSLAALNRRGTGNGSAPAPNPADTPGETLSPFWSLDIQDEGEPYVREAGNISRETANYIPRYIAASVIAAYPGRFGIRLNWSAPLHWEHLSPGIEIELTTLAGESGVPLQILRAGNGEYLDGIIPGGAHELKFPRRYSSAVRSALGSLRKTREPSGPGYYTVKPGDTLWSISRSHGIDLENLRKLNNLEQDNIIHAGMQLRLADESADTSN
ncbi:LysM peptidoglycan-binding domain-containing protein [Salinispira pacifica]|uniref:Membrane-bound lytic murein transglycosylase D n=1 Tax=Salinispira pacifica TaxID=1307761 RepID=V5WJ48_9SPIO|nr:transglycosylase SLT domain-containing protein [Salinispira pacifica]AHC15564.1 Membrane-bound lytic murein transglycosylase D precursor [Salinispira pacifica]